MDDLRDVRYCQIFKEALPLMLNIKEVETAKELMTLAVNWSVMKWLGEKKRVRKTSDIANDKLDAVDREVKATWSDELKAAYAALPTIGMPAEQGLTLPSNSRKADIDPEIALLAKALKQADEEAYRAHLLAEDTFERAEKRLSTSMAREGSRQAIISWELKEKAIIKSQAAAREGKAAS
jgi:hypothetical protein